MVDEEDHDEIGTHQQAHQRVVQERRAGTEYQRRRHEPDGEVQHHHGLIGAGGARVAPQVAQAVELQREGLQPHQDPDQARLPAADELAETGLRLGRLAVHAEEFRLHVGVAAAVVTVRMMTTVDVAVVGVAERRQQGVVDLPEPRGRAAIARDGAMADFVREEAGVNGEKRQRGERQRARGESRRGQQRDIRGRVADENERSIERVSRRRRRKTARLRELRHQRAVQPIAVRDVSGAGPGQCLRCVLHDRRPPSDL